MAINKIEIPMFNNTVGSASDAVSESNKTESGDATPAVSAKQYKQIDMANLFDMAYTLATVCGQNVFESARFYIEAHDSSDSSSAYIFIDGFEDNPTGMPTLVFSGTYSKVQNKKLKVNSYRPGAWVEYFVDTLYPSEQEKRISPIDDESIIYSDKMYVPQRHRLRSKK